jgi:protein-S-isoprenylcysteine O-methyltransferase Ste14
MIHIAVPHDLLILLRAMLLLGPLALTYYFGWRRRYESRVLIGGLFSFLYGIGLLLPAHIFAMQAGCWSYGDSALMFFGMPADIWFAGALLFGPAIFFAWPNLNPWVLTVAFMSVQGLVFHSLDPFVISGSGWFIGVVLVFLTVHIPALFLARWVARDVCLAERASLLAFGYGFLGYFVLPSIIMQAMGGSWDLEGKSVAALVITLLALMPCIIMGLAGVQMFVIHGEGTPIPLDKTKHLVRSGIYGYICNPMQCATALSWIILGLFLHNIFIMLAAGMAVVFVLGMVRWHQRSDLEVRFPEGWPEYRSHVPEWLPRWRPWVKHPSELHYNAQCPIQRMIVAWVSRQKVVGLTIVPDAEYAAAYTDGNRGIKFTGAGALVCTLFHINFLTALIGSALLLIVLPTKWVAHQMTGRRYAANV